MTTPEQPAASSPYRHIWRWHFYAGVLVAPVLVVVSVTGGLYTFKAEIDGFNNRRVLAVNPADSRATYQEQIRAAQASLPAGYTVGGLEISPEPDRATVLTFHGANRPAQRIGVDPYTGQVLGELEADTFSPWVLALHRNLFLGTTGRAGVELATGWTIVLLATGLYLWWPRRAERVRGVWLPRLRAKPYAVLRDLHTLVGLYTLPLVLVIAATGLLYSLTWGAGYRYAAQATGGGTFFSNPPKSTGAKGAPVPVDAVVATVRRLYPDQPLSVFLPRRPDDSVTVFVRGTSGASNRAYVVLHRADASVLLDRPTGEFPATARWASWNLALHVGTVGGMPTKVLWAAACAVLVWLPVTGFWMWWERRPNRRTGLPRRPDARVPRWVVAVAGVLGLLLPTVGLSMLVVVALEWGVGRAVRYWRRSRSGGFEAVAVADRGE